jgi:hypothetical protein
MTMLQQLVRSLVSQCQGLPVEVLIGLDSGEMASGRKRNCLRRQSQGDYISFVDDDDRVADDYAPQLLAATHTSPDVITFQLLRFSASGSEVWTFGVGYDDGITHTPTGVGMRANHLCAWRREVAMQIAFPDNLGYNDDCLWYKPLVALDVCYDEVHVSQPLYYYLWRPDITSNQSEEFIRRAYEWAEHGIQCFQRQDRVYIELNDGRATPGPDWIWVRNRDNQSLLVRRDYLRLYYTWFPGHSDDLAARARRLTSPEGAIE